MIKYFRLSLAALALSMVSVGFVACGDDDDPASEKVDPSKPDEPVDPVTPDKGEAKTQAEQKEYLQQVAREFMDLTPASDFRELVNLGKHIKETYGGKNYDWDNVGQWAEDIVNASRNALGTTDRVNISDYRTNVYENYKAILIASNFYSHFTASNGSWVRSDASDLQFIFKDQNGKPCVLKVETSGNSKDLYAFNVYDRTEEDYDYNNGSYTYIRYYDRTKCIIRVPENINVTLTQAGAQVLKIAVKIDLGSITNEEFDFSKDNLNVSTVVELNNGYKANLSNVTYQGNSKVAVVFELSKNGKSLVSLSAASDVSGIPSVNLGAFSEKEFDKDNYYTDDANAKNAVVKVDILGKVQVQGTCSDVRKFAEYIKKADDAEYEESNFKSYINQANGLMDLNVFYDNNAVKQATIKLEPFQKTKYDGRVKWTTEPVMVFYDGSSYSTFSAFFNESDFKAVIDDFNKLIEKYRDLVE